MNNTSATEGNSKVLVFDGKADSFNPWEIQLNAFAEVEGIVDALGSNQDPNMTHNNKHLLDPAKDRDKPMILASKTNK
jgi:hypothetical protein